MSSFDSERSTNEEFDSELQEERNPLIIAIAKVIGQVIDQNTKMENYSKIIQHQSKMSFSTRIIPQISIEDYLDRIVFYTSCEESTLIISLIYIDRITSLGNIVLSQYNVHRLLFMSLLSSIKYNEDQIYKNNFYAKIAGITTTELSNIENEFIDQIKFNFFVSEEEYKQYYTYLLQRMKLKEM